MQYDIGMSVSILKYRYIDTNASIESIDTQIKILIIRCVLFTSDFVYLQKINAYNMH